MVADRDLDWPGIGLWGHRDGDAWGIAQASDVIQCWVCRVLGWSRVESVDHVGDHRSHS